jgi:hypothetical protein
MIKASCSHVFINDFKGGGYKLAGSNAPERVAKGSGLYAIPGDKIRKRTLAIRRIPANLFRGTHQLSCRQMAGYAFGSNPPYALKTSPADVKDREIQGNGRRSMEQ